METLKKIILVCLLIASVGSFAQTSKYQSAMHRSYEFEQAKNYTNAIREVKSIYKTDDYFANLRLGWLYYLAKNYNESVKLYEKAITLKPYAIEARFGCIKPLSAQENWEKVKLQYLSVLKIDPQNTVANYWLGVIYYNRKDYKNANKLFEKVVNLYPLDYDSVIMLAWTKLQLGKSNEAKVLFNHALTLRPNDKSAMEGLKLIK
ncbi:MAG: tetratricopeptide repeat protein [Bacteroidia bacterium]|jgi:tetratricopeptide (TPR) repeat protein|nr:tetratricopeptide repeat protein [Paludibacter sp.]MDD3489664.1 tetratricopeptide repeat protein [Paludibacter sp.]NCB68242.1 tetratricopeptide repeat protein [Bacteroidia bacterium]